jgi:tetratricopeptide (TPR) repeat protein
MYAGDFTAADAEARAALSGNPNLPKAYLAMAMAALATGKPDEARAAYARARATGARGESLATIGLADLAMYEGRFDEAVSLLAAGIEADQQAKNSAGAAAKAMALAEAEHARGGTAAALNAVERARGLAQDPSVLVPAAQLLLKSGRAAEAAKIADQLDSALAPRSRAYGRLVSAMLLLERRRSAEALQALDEARALADLWLVRFYKGLAYLDAGEHAQALAELELCGQKRRGEATALFLDDMPTYRSVVPLSYWLGRAHEALGARDAAARHLRAYLALRSPGTDALARDAAKRLE